MKQFTLFFTIIVALSLLAGCSTVKSVTSMVTSTEFWKYGYCEDAMMRVSNNTPHAIRVAVGGDPNRYVVPAGTELLIPGRYPVFSRTQVRIPVTATVNPPDPTIRGGGIVWYFNHNGHSLYGGGLTTGREVHATVELSSPRADARTNSLVFRIYQ